MKKAIHTHRLFKWQLFSNSCAAFLLLLTVCTSFSSCQNDYSADDRQLTVSIEPLRYITEAIAGDCYTVKTLTPEGVSPEAYMPTPQQIASINKGSAYVYLGSLGFEQQNLNKIIENCPHLYVINVSENIPLISNEGCCTTDSSDPHIWTSPKNIRTIAHNIHKALCHMDSANVTIYNQRLAAFTQHMDSINKAIHKELDSISNRTFLINHPALAYFANQYNLKQLSVEKDGKEASAERVAQLIKDCREAGVKMVFLQKQNSKRIATHIAEEIGADTLTINPLSFDWDQEMLHIAKSLNP